MNSDANGLKEQLKLLTAEMENFEEIGGYLKHLPGEIPSINHIDIYGEVIPLQGRMGGDHLIYVDFNKRYNLNFLSQRLKKEGRDDLVEELEGNRRKAGILLADVAGHRVTDYLLVGMLHQAFLLGVVYELKYQGRVTVDLFENINARFRNSSSIAKFITMIYGEIADTGNFRFISVGHYPPVVFSNEFNKIVEISEDRLVNYPPIGTMSNRELQYGERQPNVLSYKEKYTINEINLLGPGDLLLLYTDGFYEYHNEEGEEYFKTSLESKLREVKSLSAKEILGHIRDDLFLHGPPQDDLSLVVIKKT